MKIFFSKSKLRFTKYFCHLSIVSHEYRNCFLYSRFKNFVLGSEGFVHLTNYIMVDDLKSKMEKAMKQIQDAAGDEQKKKAAMDATVLVKSMTTGKKPAIMSVADADKVHIWARG